MSIPITLENNWIENFLRALQSLNQPKVKTMTAEIKRIRYQEKQTLGEFFLYKDGKEIFNCKTLELPWKDNQFQISCVPKGNYKVVPRTSQKFKKHFHLLDVPNRTYILIHAGNYYTDILGCILVGSAYSDINKDGYLDVTSSKKTLGKILSLSPDGFDLIIS